MESPGLTLGQLAVSAASGQNLKIVPDHDFGAARAVSTSAPIDKRQATIHALVTGLASAICLILASAWDLKQPNLAVWTTFLVMAQHSYSSFQKGVERIIGRGIGIFLGLVVVTWLNGMPLVVLMIVGVLLTAFFYLYFAGRLAYTFLQAGLYLVAVLEIGTAAPTTVFSEAKELFAAIVVGVVVADLVNWLVGSEGDLGLKLGDTPLFPIRGEWINQSVMLSVTVLVTLVGAHVIGLPPAQSAIFGDFGDCTDGGSPSAGADRERRTAAVGTIAGHAVGAGHIYFGRITPLFSAAGAIGVLGRIRGDLFHDHGRALRLRRFANGTGRADAGCLGTDRIRQRDAGRATFRGDHSGAGRLDPRRGHLALFPNGRKQTGPAASAGSCNARGDRRVSRP
jgi:hypothetical protein